MIDHKSKTWPTFKTLAMINGKRRELWVKAPDREAITAYVRSIGGDVSVCNRDWDVPLTADVRNGNVDVVVGWRGEVLRES